MFIALPGWLLSQRQPSRNILLSSFYYSYNLNYAFLQYMYAGGKTTAFWNI